MKKTKRDRRSATNVDRLIGARIRERRLDLGMSQEALAEAIGVTFQQVQKYENGINRVAASTLIDIADALEVDASVLLPQSTRQGAAGPSSDDVTAQDVTRYVGRLNTEGRRILLIMARTLAADGKLRAKNRK